ncbi:chordin [Patella vulgata]|uniref:chordin n=1 Tax=Patella vulgata TaxID=6465 RepID=UPI00217F667C|nr:chordin [Patella vulgata]
MSVFSSMDLAVFLLVLSVYVSDAKLRKIPLKPVKENLNGIQPNRPGCILGGKFYDIGEKWTPSILPVGEMFCVKCECVPVERKGIIDMKGQTRCKNIKDLCPRPNCVSPVLPKGKCCKVCPDEVKSFEDKFTLGLSKQVATMISSDSKRRARTEFVALLVGKNVRREGVETSAVAAVYLSVISNDEIRYSVRYHKLDRPKFLQITDANGNVLFERPIEKRRNGDKRFCGIWSKVPAAYVQFVRKERLFAVITSSRYSSGLVSGRLMVNRHAKREVFSSVLASPKPAGIGGLLSVIYNPRTHLVDYVITFDGLFPGSSEEYFVTIGKKSKVLHQSTGKADSKTRFIRGSWTLSNKRQSKQLARGRLHLRLTSSNGASVSGDIRPKLTCGVSQTILSSGSSLENVKLGSSGTAIFELREKGTVEYKIRLTGLTSKVHRIRLEGAVNKKNRRQIIGSVHKNFKADENSFNGWSNGTFKKMTADNLHLFLNNKMFLNVATTKHRISELRGRVIALPYHQHFTNGAVVPATLSALSSDSFGQAGNAWFSMEIGCSLHYDITITSQDNQNDITISLVSPTDPDTYVTIEKIPSTKLFESRLAIGSITDIPEDLFHDLDDGTALLVVLVGKTRLAGNVSVPNTCWQYSQDYDMDILVDEQTSEEVVAANRYKCFYEGSVYENGDSWLPDVNATCNTCSCNKGKIECHALICPVLACANKITVDGECCPTCVQETSESSKDFFCKLDGDLRRHRVGSTWHPFLPLMGYAKCVICTCMPGGVSKCERKCPKLDCSKSRRIRLNPTDCCQVCAPEEKKPVAAVKPLQDVDMKGACTFKEQIFANGAKWHPRVMPFGYMKCIDCTCNSGTPVCQRPQCPKLTCSRKIRKQGACCDACADEQPLSEVSEEKKSGSCVFGGKKYDDGQTFQPGSSALSSCALCTCTNGSMKCSMTCPKSCSDPKKKDNPCCKHCA